MTHRSTLNLVSRTLLVLSVAAATHLVLGATLDWRQRLLAAWCTAALCFLAQAVLAFGPLGPDEVRERCQRRQRGLRALMLGGCVLIGLVSIGAVIYLLTDVRASSPHYRLHLVLSLASVVLSWMSLQALFAIAYARMYYEGGDRSGEAGGVRFTGGGPPDYWDFLYFSFTLAMCYGVTDVVTTSRHVRRITLLQSLLAFFYYTVIVGLVMNAIGTLL